MVTLGCVFLPSNPPDRLLPVARAADTAGLAELWLWEDCFKESCAAAAGAVLAGTARISVGLGVLPVPLRNVALTAMELSTLAGIAPGRLLPGVGHGIQSWMGQAGARVNSPLTLLREHLTALRPLLAGERVSVSGRYVTLDGVALDWPPGATPPLLSAGFGPKTLRLVGELAQGVVLVAEDGVDGVRRDLALVDEGRTRAGLPPVADSGPGSEHPFGVVAFIRTPTDDRDPDRVATELRPYGEAGVASVVVEPAEDEPDPEELVAFLGSEVAPLLR